VSRYVIEARSNRRTDGCSSTGSGACLACAPAGIEILRRGAQ
jgi:hypothetical protein